MGSVIIIGAGIAGLACARKLHGAGVTVRVFEKSRSLAGRCASRRFEEAIIDTGLQYFTATSDRFLAEVQALVGPALRTLELPALTDAMQPLGKPTKFYHADGNNRLGNALAEGLHIEREHPVTRIDTDAGKWIVDGAECDAVVSSAPWPQTAGLLGQSDDTGYYACLTAAFAYSGPPTGLAASTYGLGGSGALAWSACENAKVGRVPSGTTVMIAQAGPEFSRAHFEVDREEWGTSLRTMVEARWEIDSGRFVSQFTHRWKYARRAIPIPAAENLPAGFFVTGDSLAASRLEDVWCSGEKSADAVLAWI